MDTKTGKSGKSAIMLISLLLLLAIPVAQAGCTSYAKHPATHGTCCQGLVEKNFDGTTGFNANTLCTQPNEMCSLMPELYTYTYQAPSGPPSPNSPQGVTEALSQGTGAVNAASGIYQTGWFTNWSTSGFVGIAIVVSIIALVAMVGYAFNLPELKAFVDAELMQAVVSTLLIIGLLGLIGFFHAVSMQLVSQMNLPVACDNSHPCYVTAAKSYLNSTEEIAYTSAHDLLENGIKLQRQSSFGAQTQLNKWYLLFAGTSIRLDAGESIRAERAASLFEMTSKIIASLRAQNYFIDVVSFGIAPIFLLFGIVLRTFFFTRKLGGLLLAIAVSLFFVYPLTYAFAWYTLNTTVYGDRVIASTDPTCPDECTAHFPVAFFINSTNGAIVQFDTTQQLMISGITEANWPTGGSDLNGDGIGDFPGLTACRNLSDAKLRSNVIDYSCKECPDYCREVPFPSSMPGCNITKCSSDYNENGVDKSCNPGCKIMRQRTDCKSKCSGSATCSTHCRTKTPAENKCYVASEEGTPQVMSPANLSVSCKNCEGCPQWCKFLYQNSSGYFQIYPDDACAVAACKTPKMGGSCPEQCFYTTEIGTDTDCERSCTSDGVVCPRYCRIVDLALLSAFDATNPKLISECTSDNAIKAACAKCSDDCKITVPQPPNPASCAQYPSATNNLQNCQACPIYCRFNNFNFVPSYSSQWFNLGIPEQCSGQDISCANSNCAATCRTAETPLICREYSGAAGETVANCRACPMAGRVLLAHTDQSGYSYSSYIPAYNTGPMYTACRPSNCNNPCKTVLTIPPQQGAGSGATCKDFGAVPAGECSTCPYSCRLAGTGIAFDPACATLCANCSASNCMATYTGTAPITVCSEYLGNGPDGECAQIGAGTYCLGISKAACLLDSNCAWDSYYTCEGGAGMGCDAYADATSCKTHPLCSWRPSPAGRACFGPAGCDAYGTQADCADHAPDGCSWKNKDDPSIPFGLRPNSDYTVTTNCKQCPEICRIVGYTGDCGLSSDAVDCSYSSCAPACRVSAPPSPSTGHNECLDVPTGTDCAGCPVFCRRQSDTPTNIGCSDYAGCSVSDLQGGAGCSNTCRLPNAPNQLCEGCFDCPIDCTYYPAIVTDCSERCSEEALAGPVNIAPGDFVKKLPGAEGESDVKNLGNLMVPATVLPLFCIVIVLSFIHVFSPILGGDIEIPGIGRIL